MNIKWVVDGVSDYTSFLSCVSTSRLARAERTSWGILRNTRHARLHPPGRCRVQTYIIVGLIKQLADVGTALS